MKITKKQLEEIIKEEIEKSLQEGKEVKVEEKTEEEQKIVLTSSFIIDKIINIKNKELE